MEQNVDTGVPVINSRKQAENGNRLKIATAVACAVAVCGIGFGICVMIQGFQKDKQISDLKVEVNDKSTMIDELETKISNLDSKKEEVAINTETTASQESSNNSSDIAAILLGTMLDKNDSRAVFKIGDCTADGPSVKCPVTVDGKDALISYNSNDSILRLSLPND